MTNSKITQSALSAGLIVGGGLLLGRIAGFFREVVLANFLGVSSNADIAVLLLTLPDLIMALFIGGAANIVLIPYFQELTLKKRFSSFIYISLWVFFIFSILSIVLYLFKGELVHLLAPGMNDTNYQKSMQLIGHILIAIPFLTLTSVGRAYLQAEHRFAITSTETFLHNAIIVGGIIFLIPLYNLTGLVYAIFIGIFLRWSIQFISIYKRDFQKISFLGVSIKKSLVISYIQALGAGIILVLLPIVGRSFASLYKGEGGIALFNYSLKLIELPFGVTISVFSIVLFPKLSKIMKKNLSLRDNSEAIELISTSMRSLFLFSFPVSCAPIWFFLKLLTKDITIFSIPQESFKLILIIAITGIIALPLRGLSTLHLAIMSAQKNTVIPFWINFSALVLSIPLIYVLIQLLGLMGIGIALTLLYFWQCLLEILVLKIKYKIFTIEPLLDKKVLITIAAGLLLYGGMWWCSALFEKNDPTNFTSEIVIDFTISLLTGLFFFFFNGLFDPNFKYVIRKLVSLLGK